MKVKGTQKEINDYDQDQSISPGDKIIGQDSHLLKETKNYSVQGVAVHVKGGVGEAGQVLKNNGDGTWGWKDADQSVTTTTTTEVPTTTTTTAAPTTTTTTAATTTTTTQAATTTTTTATPTTTTTSTTTTTAAPTTTTTTTNTTSTTTTTTSAPTTTTTTIISQNQTPGTVVNTDYWKLVWIRKLDFTNILIGDSYGSSYYPANDDGWTATSSKITNLQGTGPYSSLGNRAFKLDTNSLQVGAFITDTNGTFINSNNTHDTTYNRSYSDFSTPMYAAVKTSLRSETTVDETLLVKVEQYNGYVRITELIDIS